MKKPRYEPDTDPFFMLLDAMSRGSTDGLIERQEEQGQQSFVGSDTLPMDLGNVFLPGEPDGKAILEAAGVKFLGPVEGDDLFQYVELPDGWKKEATDHSMWSKLLDAEGNERASIFYKAAFYDRNAFASVRELDETT